VHLNDALRYGETQTSPALLPRDCVVGLLELLKQLGLYTSGVSGAGVPNLHMECAIVGFGLDGHFTGVGELDGVADKINEDLGQAPPVAVARR